MHDREVNIPVFDFLKGLQLTTKKLNENALELIRKNRTSEFLLANANAKRVLSENAHYDEENGLDEKIEVPQLLNGCVYFSQNHFQSQLSFRQLILLQNLSKTEKSTTKRKPKTKFFCGNCAKDFGRSSGQHPSVWCNVSVQ